VRHQLAGVLEREGFDVHDLRREARRIHRGLALFDVFSARRDQQDIVRFGILLRRSEDLEVIGDFVHRKGDVLVGLHLDLSFQIALAQVARHLDDFRDGRVAGNRDRDFFCAGAGALHRATDRLADRFRVDDRFLVHGVLRSRLGRVRFDAISATAHHQLDQFDRRSGYVKPEQRAIFAR
jgi:hypothetical protein